MVLKVWGEPSLGPIYYLLHLCHSKKNVRAFGVTVSEIIVPEAEAVAVPLLPPCGLQ